MTTKDLLALAEGWPRQPVSYKIKPDNMFSVIVHLIIFRSQFSEN